MRRNMTQSIPMAIRAIRAIRIIRLSHQPTLTSGVSIVTAAGTERCIVVHVLRTAAALLRCVRLSVLSEL